LGDHEVTASAEGYQSEKRDVTVEEENEQKVIDFPLRQRRAIHNREELEALAADANAAYYLANDIDLSGEPWVPNCWFGGSLEQVLPGMCIGGDYFGNYEGQLPKAKGRRWTECDINTLGARSRGPERIIFSNDGLIYYTPDHYESFELLYG
jgi:hypothetical protein